MLIVMEPDATPEQVEAVCAVVREHGGSVKVLQRPEPAVAVTGIATPIPTERIALMDGVSECVNGDEAPRLARLDRVPERTTIEVRGERIGPGGFAIIAGPCAVESRDQVMRTAESLAKAGVKFFRGGAYKPRTSPYSFQGLREEGLRLLAEVRSAFDLRIVTEVMDPATMPLVSAVADIVQIGSRNMHHYPLLSAAGRLRQPVLLKRGFGATIHEWLNAAEYVLSGGNGQLILCERGIRTFETATRNTLDLGGAIVARQQVHLPVIVDPSHGVGIAEAVAPLACAAAAAGVDGVMIEVHCDPESARSDAKQAMSLAEFARLKPQLAAISQLIRAS